MAINLVPPELVPKGAVRKFSAKIRAVVFVATIVLIAGVTGAFSYILFLNSQIEKSQQRQTELLSSIKSMRTAESLHYVIKERVARVDELISSPSIVEASAKLDQYILQLPPSTSFQQGMVIPKLFEVTIRAEDANSLVAATDTVLSSGLYENIVISGLSYDQTKKYSATFQISK